MIEISRFFLNSKRRWESSTDRAGFGRVEAMTKAKKGKDRDEPRADAVRLTLALA